MKDYNSIKSNKRRKLLLGASTGIFMSSTLSKLAFAATDNNKLIIHGPQSSPSIALSNINVPDLLSDNMPDLGFKIWSNLDQLEQGLQSGDIKAAVMPIQVAAKLYNQGIKLKLLNVMTNGFMYILTNNPEMGGIASLKDKKIAVPAHEDMANVVFDKILASYKLTPKKDITIIKTDSPTEAIEMLLAGKVDASLTPEPACSVAIAKAKELENSVYRTIDIQTLWGEITESDPIIPQAGLVIADSLDESMPSFSDRLQTIIEKTVERVNNDPLNSGANATKVLDFPAQIISASIPTSNLVATRAEFAKANIENILNIMSEHDAAIIGGKLPDSDFYL